jgi:hypothetical protein
MRAILLLWAIPLAFFWSWYGLSANDISFGTIFFSRALHDVVFETYARTLGLPAAAIPGMIAWACLVDTGVILAIAAFRWRAHWLPQAMDRIADLRNRLQPRPVTLREASQADQALPAE